MGGGGSGVSDMGVLVGGGGGVECLIWWREVVLGGSGVLDMVGTCGGGGAKREWSV